MRDAVEAGQKLGQQIQVVNASSDREIEVAFDTLREIKPGALLVQPDAFLINRRIVALAERDALPVMYQTRDLVAAGGLMQVTVAAKRKRLASCRFSDGRLL